ncbi:hypothetical protein D3C85_1232570 [compost metagenome]
MVFLFPAQQDKPTGAVQFGHVGVDADVGLVPVQRHHPAQVLGAEQVDLAGDAVETDDQAAGGEDFEAEVGEDVLEVEVQRYDGDCWNQPHENIVKYV